MLQDLWQLFLKNPGFIRWGNRVGELYLNDKEISYLPPQIGEIKGLVWLMLGDNNLQFLPEEIGKLTDLTKLHLESNKLIHLPTWLVNFTHLQDLDLSENELEDVPDEMAQIRNLNVKNNRLKRIPQGLDSDTIEEQGWSEQKK